MKKNISDPLEKIIENILIKNNIKFEHEKKFENIDIRLDFYLPDYDIFIEVKKFHSERTSKQLKVFENIILVQGKKSVTFLEKYLNIKNTK